MVSPQLKQLDLNLILVLHHIIQEKHISRAALELGMTQSAVSHALNRIRNYFDDPVLIRNGRQMVLSPFAERVAGELQEILNNIHGLKLLKPEFDPFVSKQSFKIGLPEYLAIRYMSELTKVISDLAPHIHITTVNINKQTGLGVLDKGGVDLIIGHFQGVPKKFRQQTLFVEDFVGACRNKHPLIKSGKVTKENYFKASHMHVSLAGKNYGHLDESIKKEALSRDVKLTISNYMLGLFMVEDNDYLLTEPRQAVEPFIDKFNIDVFELPFDSPTFEVSMIWHHQNNTSPAHTWFREQIVNIDLEQ